jgi:hypothetical protein
MPVRHAHGMLVRDSDTALVLHAGRTPVRQRSGRQPDRLTRQSARYDLLPNEW